MYNGDSVLPQDYYEHYRHAIIEFINQSNMIFFNCRNNT